MCVKTLKRICISFLALQSWPTGLGHISASHVTWYIVLVWCVLALVAVSQGCLMWMSGNPSIHVSELRLGLRGLSSQVLTSFGRARFITWHLRCPILGKCQWSSRLFLDLLGVSGLWPCALLQCKKGIVPHFDVYRIPNKHWV